MEELTEFIGIAYGVWARSDTFDGAVKAAREEAGDAKGKVVVYLVHPDSYVTEYGSISSPRSHKPKRLTVVES